MIEETFLKKERKLIKILFEIKQNINLENKNKTRKITL